MLRLKPCQTSNYADRSIARMADGVVVPVSLLWLINSTLNLMTLFAPVLHVLRTASGFIFLNRFSLYYVFFISLCALYHVFFLFVLHLY